MMDFVGYVERFETDFQKVCQILKLNDVERVNANVRNNPKQECDPHDMKRSDYKYLNKYTKTAIEIVNDCYAIDFESFGYQKIESRRFLKTHPMTPLSFESAYV